MGTHTIDFVFDHRRPGGITSEYEYVLMVEIDSSRACLAPINMHIHMCTT